MATTSVIANLPNTDEALLEDMASAAYAGNHKSMDYLAGQAAGANLATIKRIAATHGVEYDGYGTTGGDTIDVFLYASSVESADAVVAALKEAGIMAKIGRTVED